MSGLVDIHAHLLPGIDDGPQTLEGALEMARAAVAAGIGTVAATPHLRSDFPGVHVEELAERCAELRAELRRAEIPLEVVEGAEVSLLWALNADQQALRQASFGQRGADLLIETPHDVTTLERLLQPLRSAGYRITLAHPERSHTFHHRPELLTRLYEQGVMAQVNGGALLAPRRSPVRRYAEQLCREGIAHVIASDGHRGLDWRPVGDLPAGLEAAALVVGEARARWMGSEAPAAVLEGCPLLTAPPVEAPHGRRGWFRR